MWLQLSHLPDVDVKNGFPELFSCQQSSRLVENENICRYKKKYGSIDRLCLEILKNNVEKGQTVSFSHKVFLIVFPQCHKSDIILYKPIPTQRHLLTPLGNKPFENTVGKGAISPFSTVFSTRSDTFLPFSSNLKLSSANSFSLEESEICRLVMG